MKLFGGNNDEPSYLLITSDRSEHIQIPLTANESLFIGSGLNCRVVLEDQNVDPIHCMVWMSADQVLRLQDWNTGGKTLVNGEVANEELILKSGDKVTICQHTVTVILDQVTHERETNRLLVSNMIQSEPQADATDVQEVAEAQHVADELNSDSAESILEDNSNVNSFSAIETEDQTDQGFGTPELTPPESFLEPKAEETSSEQEPVETEQQTEPQPAKQEWAENSWEEDSWKEDSWENNGWDQVSSADSTSSAFDPIPKSKDEKDEEIELLRMEIEQLQIELAERDAQLNENESFETSDFGGPPLGDSQESNESFDETETLQLVNRLEELLDELQTSDERIRGLEDLLQAADQATRAEQEERQQLESWITEIEERVSQREQESEAELDRVRQQLQEATERKDQSDQQFQQFMASQNEGQDLESLGVIKDLKEQVDQLQQQLTESTREADKLRRMSQVTDDESATREALRQMEAKLMISQVETARERAEISRQRAELARMKDELEEKLRTAKEMGAGDSRVQAMRQHLREIHEEEKFLKAVKKQQSLGGRIARLLKRV